MKYTTEIIVEIPRDAFIKKLDSIENFKHWQRGFIDYEHVSGVPGKIGAQMKLNYKFGKRRMDLIETITYIDFPNEFHATYNAKGMHNVQNNYFEKISDNHTKWVSINEFYPTTFAMRMMTLFMPGTFKKQSKKYLEDFKNFAEKGTSVSHA